MIPAFMTILPVEADLDADITAEECMEGPKGPRTPLVEKHGGGAYMVGCLTEYDETVKQFRNPGYFYVSLN